MIADELLAQTGLTKLYERSDSNVRKLEGLPEVTGWLRGECATGVVLREHDWQLSLDVAEGHKTGFYLDQRDSRKKFADYALACSFSACSIAIATQAVSPWPHWLAVRRM